MSSEYLLLLIEYIRNLCMKIEKLLFFVIFHRLLHNSDIILRFVFVLLDELRLNIFFNFILLLFFLLLLKPLTGSIIHPLFLLILRHALIYGIFLAQRIISLLLWLWLFDLFWLWSRFFDGLFDFSSV
jgi:hypothetical protein